MPPKDDVLWKVFDQKCESNARERRICGLTEVITASSPSVMAIYVPAPFLFDIGTGKRYLYESLLSLFDSTQYL